MRTAIPENMSRIGAVWRLTELEIHPNPKVLPSTFCRFMGSVNTPRTQNGPENCENGILNFSDGSESLAIHSTHENIIPVQYGPVWSSLTGLHGYFLGLARFCDPPRSFCGAGFWSKKCPNFGEL